MREWARRRPRGDRGDATTVSLVIVFPVLLLFFFAIVQAGVWFYARNMAMAAAESGAREGRIAASAQVGVDAAQDFLEQVSNDTFSQVAVSSAGSSATRVQVTVTGQVPSLFPGLWDLGVSQSASGPIEAPR